MTKQEKMVLNLLQNKRYIFLKLSDMEYINQPRKVLDKTEWMAQNEAYRYIHCKASIYGWELHTYESAKSKGYI